MIDSRNLLERARLGLGVAAALWGVGNMSFFLMPHLIEGLVAGEIGLSESRAGLVGTIELLCLAGTILALSPRMGAIVKHRLAIAGIVAAAAGYLASALFDQFLLIIACRIVAGIGAGCSMAAAHALVAFYEEPEQGVCPVVHCRRAHSSRYDRHHAVLHREWRSFGWICISGGVRGDFSGDSATAVSQGRFVC